MYVCVHTYIYIRTYISRYWVALARSTYTYTASRTSNRPRVQSCPPAFTDTTWGEGDVVSWCSRTPGFHGLYRNFGCLRVEGGGSGCAHTRLIYVNWRWRWRCTRARARVCACVYVCIRCRLYLCTHRPTAVGRASFVECGLILMGTDDKQRKQASSLPGEICLLLPRVQWDPVRYTRIYARGSGVYRGGGVGRGGGGGGRLYAADTKMSTCFVFRLRGKNGVAADVVGENIAMINIFELNGS